MIVQVVVGDSHGSRHLLVRIIVVGGQLISMKFGTTTTATTFQFTRN